MVRAPAGKVRIKAVAHHGDGIALALQHRQLGYHGLGLCGLIFAAVGHKYGSSADGAVEHFHQTLLGANVQVFQRIQPFGADICYRFLFFKEVVLFGRHLHFHGGLLMSAVGVQEGTGNVYNLLASPLQHQAGLLGDNGHRHSLQVFFFCVSQELVKIGRIDYHSHTLLGLGNGDLRSVQSLVFLRHLVQVHHQACCQLTDGYRHTACAEIVALLDETADFLSAEQALDLPLGRRIALLHLCAARLNGLLGMYFGGTGSTAAAVTAGTAAQQHDNIAGIGCLTDDCFSRSRAHDSADLHSLCHIIGMIDLFYQAGSQADLVAVGAVAAGCTADKLLLGQLSFQCLVHGTGRVCRAGDTHGLINVRTAGQRVTDGAAQTGCCTAERLDLCGMVVGLIFKVDEPLLGLAVDLHRHHDAAGVDLVRLLLIL